MAAPGGAAELRVAGLPGEGGVVEFISVLCCGRLFGAALYITLAQHPAVLKVGPPFASRFFGPMYRRAATMQVPLAGVGTRAGF